MQWIPIPLSHQLFLYTGCNGQRKFVVLVKCMVHQFFLQNYMEVIEPSWFTSLCAACVFRYLITAGAVMALCSTLMGSMLPQVI
jgi:hypothetical protein